MTNTNREQGPSADGKMPHKKIMTNTNREQGLSADGKCLTKNYDQY